MIDEIIKYETAVIAKEKGFDENTSFYYDFEGVRRGFLAVGGRNNTSLDKWTDGGKKISASTQSLLQKWLREVHKMQVMVEVNFFNEELQKWEGYACTVFTLSSDHNKHKTVSFFNTYEEALEEGLIEALKLI